MLFLPILNTLGVKYEFKASLCPCGIDAIARYSPHQWLAWIEIEGHIVVVAVIKKEGEARAFCLQGQSNLPNSACHVTVPKNVGLAVALVVVLEALDDARDTNSAETVSVEG